MVWNVLGNLGRGENEKTRGEGVGVLVVVYFDEQCFCY